MKNIRHLACLIMFFACCSCIGDLDTLPLNETDKTAQQVYQTKEDFEKVLAYVYGSFSLVSQNNPHVSDIAVGDAGQSDLIRQFVMLNEMSADGLKCIWGDSYITDLQNNSWSSTPNSAITAVYTRTMMIITRANEFLLQSSQTSIEGIQGLRAEARFLRALAYYIMMDLFGNPPFALENNIGGEMPSQIGREALFNWIEKELKELHDGTEMPEIGDVPYPRATKGAVSALLARMYLNAETYTGTPRWKEARNYASDVISSGKYSLCTNYEHLFLQDNTENEDARKEFIFAIAYDGLKTQTWGGTSHFLSACLDYQGSLDIARLLGYPEGSLITRDSWNGYHVPDEYVAFFELSDITWEEGRTGFGYNRETSDRRALFYNVGCTKEYEVKNASTGWRCWKYTSRDSQGKLYSRQEDPMLSSADFALFRLAEMYLIYAEAQARIDGGRTSDPLAIQYIQKLRSRAGVSTPSYIDTEFILKERARELMWEGHRRTDLIRYGYYTSRNFPWPYKGGIPDGKVELDTYRTVYPILESELNENLNLVQNEGY